MTVSGENYKKAYDGKAHGKAAIANVTDGTKISYSVDGGTTWKNEYPTITNVGKVTVQVQATNANYVTATATYTLEVTRAPVTVTANNQTKVYGEKDPTLDAKVEGTVGKDTVDYTLNRAEGESVGTYAITPSGEAIQGNYMVTYMPGTLTINPLEGVVVTIKGHADTATYDGKPHSVDGYDIVSISNDLYHATDFVADENKGVSVSGTDAETYQMDLKPERFKNTNKNFANVEFVVEEDGKLVITPAPLKITTNSAEKTYDESALTAGGKIEGLVKGETATLKTTGSQTEVGESKNTYEIVWGTAKASNYEITEDIGTLKVNARSGGGSSSKPTPEEEPTPTPTPTPLPTLPTTPAPTTPARRVTRSTATVTEPASRPTEQITENETPKAESEPEVIEDEETPLAPMATGAWALVNLILMLLTVLASLLLLLGYLGKKKYAKEDEYGNALHDANGNEIIDYTRNKKGFWRVASLIPAIAAVIAFALTENMRLPMVMTDRWTLLMVIIAVVQLIVAVLCKKKKESEEDENQANA